MGGGGFRKKGGNSKKKAKKSKKGKNVDREWNHEGGTRFDDEVEQAQEKKRARRDTQDRDERLRRGRAKIDYQKEQRERLQKMRRGISFKKEVEAEKGTVEAPAEEEKAPHVQFKSSKSVLSRLQAFVAAASTGAGGLEEEGEEEDEANGGQTDGADLDDSEDFPESGPEEGASDADSVASGPVQLAAAVPDRLPWLFDAESVPGALPATYRPMGEQLGMSVFEQLSEDISKEDLFSSRCRRWCDIPGLHKMFDPVADLSLDRFSQRLLPYLLSYADVFLDGCDHSNISNVERSIGIHVAQHIIRVRSIMQKNNDKLKKKKVKAAVKDKKQKLSKINDLLDAELSEEEPSGGSGDEAGAGPAERPRPPPRDTAAAPEAAGAEEGEAGAMQDQGFTRPRILIICPFRASARRVVESLAAALGDLTSVGGIDKFNEEFGRPEDEEQEQEHGKSKPADWKALFDDNTDDDFKMGIQVTPGQGKGTGARKGALLRLYSDFYMSDIILASPLGLRLVVAGKDNMSFDFLSSVEMTFLHQADVLYMQNWDHVTHVFEHLNQMPKHNHDTDFSRVRPYFLDGRAPERSQLIVTSKFNDPLIWNVFRKYGRSIAGHVRFKPDSGDVGCLGEVTSRVKQIFQLISCADHTQLEAVRFDYFKKNVLSPMLRLNQGRTLIVTPSYISYIKVRNELIREEANAAFVCEYSRESEISRGRSRFYHGHKNIMVYSGRAHFFRRFMIRGACHIVFYSLPEYAQFYPELVNLIQETDGSNNDGADGSNSISCTVLFTKFEKMALERIVGTKRCEHMLSSGKNTFMFC